MAFFIGLFIFVLFAASFARMDANLIKIAKSIESIEKELTNKKEK